MLVPQPRGMLPEVVVVSTPPRPRGARFPHLSCDVLSPCRRLSSPPVSDRHPGRRRAWKWALESRHIVCSGAPPWPVVRVVRSPGADSCVSLASRYRNALRSQSLRPAARSSLSSGSPASRVESPLASAALLAGAFLLGHAARIARPGPPPFDGAAPIRGMVLRTSGDRVLVEIDRGRVTFDWPDDALPAPGDPVAAYVRAPRPTQTLPGGSVAALLRRRSRSRHSALRAHGNHPSGAGRRGSGRVARGCHAHRTAPRIRDRRSPGRHRSRDGPASRDGHHAPPLREWAPRRHGRAVRGGNGVAAFAPARVLVAAPGCARCRASSPRSEAWRSRCSSGTPLQRLAPLGWPPPAPCCDPEDDGSTCGTSSASRCS